MLLAMRHWAVNNGHNLYVKCPADINAPGGDAYEVRTVETDGPDGSITRSIVVMRQPAAYQTAEASNRLYNLQNERATKIKEEKSYRAQVAASVNDPATHQTAKARHAEIVGDIEAMDKKIKKLMPEAEMQKSESWVFPIDMAGVVFTAEVLVAAS